MMNPVTLLSLGRIAVGVAAVAKPELVAKQMTGQAEDPPVLTQWFGNREIALGVVTLLARGSGRGTLVLAGVAVDAADAGTAYAAMQNGTLPKKLGRTGDRGRGRRGAVGAARPAEQEEQEVEEGSVEAV